MSLLKMWMSLGAMGLTNYSEDLLANGVDIATKRSICKWYDPNLDECYMFDLKKNPEQCNYCNWPMRDK